jgi:hypothetical protein
MWKKQTLSSSQKIVLQLNDNIISLTPHQLQQVNHMRKVMNKILSIWPSTLPNETTSCLT